MQNDTFNRVWLMFRIEWNKRWKMILGLILAYLIFILIGALISAERMMLSDSFFGLHYLLGFNVLIFSQLATLYPEWSSNFQSCQLIQLPTRPLEKHLTRLSFPLLIAPGLYTLGFILFLPICQAICLQSKGFTLYPVYGSDLFPGYIRIVSMSFIFGVLLIPGSLIFKRGHLIKSLGILGLLFTITALVSGFLDLPGFKSDKIVDDGLIFGLYQKQLESLGIFDYAHGLVSFTFWTSASFLILTSSCLLFKTREV
jgi:hypothetical protein